MLRGRMKVQRGSGRTDKNSVAANTHLMNLEVDAALNRILSEQNRLSELSPAKVSTREVEENEKAMDMLAMES